MTFELLSNISLVQFGSFVGLLNGAYTLYMLLARARIRLFLADSIGIVHPPREVADRFHLACNFVNARGKVGAVHRLEATVLDPEKIRGGSNGTCSTNMDREGKSFKRPPIHFLLRFFLGATPFISLSLS
jgi:hypothetical protein